MYFGNVLYKQYVPLKPGKGKVSILLIPHPGDKSFGPVILAGIKQMEVSTTPFFSKFTSLSGRPNVTLFVWAPRYRYLYW